MGSKKAGIAISMVALVMIVGMFVGVGNIFRDTTDDLGVALEKIKTDTTIAKVTDEDMAATKAYRGAEATFDPMVAADEMGFREPLGESVTTRADQSRSLVSLMVMEIVAISVLAFALVFVASRIVKNIINN